MKVQVYKVVKDECGTVSWYDFDHPNRLHRVGGPAVEDINGDKHWYLNGKCHRVDGPAVECANGTKYWYFNGKLHRFDGPAIEYVGGGKIWYLNGESLTEAEFNARKTMPLPCEGMVIEVEGRKYQLKEIK